MDKTWWLQVGVLLIGAVIVGRILDKAKGEK